MIEFMPYVWAIITLAAIFVEANTADLVTIWFIPAGIISVIISLLPVKIAIWLHVLLFFVIALALLLMSKTLFKEFFKKKPIERTNLDAVIGREAIVTEEINNILGKGAVKVLGKEWSAITEENGEVIEKDTIVIVKEIRGVKLICEKK